MKKILILLFFAFIIGKTYSQEYKEDLRKINDYLKNFDNGYYGYLEIINGTLYDRFPSGKYWKVSISDLGKASVAEAKRKVEIKCISGDQCVFSTYTDSYHGQISFSQSNDFDTKELIGLLDNFTSSYNKKDAPKTSTSSYTDALKKVNDFLKTFDNGYYGYLEIKGEYLYDRYKSGKYCNVNIYDLSEASIAEVNRKVVLKCKNSSDCVFSTYTDSYHSDLPFSSTTDFNTTKLADLLDDVIQTFKTKTVSYNSGSSTAAEDARKQKDRERQKQNSTTTTTTGDNELLDIALNAFLDKTIENSGKYSNALKNLNTYLKTFNPETYNDVEVKDNKVYFNFNYSGKKYSSYISINDLTKNTTIGNDGSEVKIKCKGEGKYFYSTYSVGYADHFRFFSNTIKDLSKMENLVYAFVDALK